MLAASQMALNTIDNSNVIGDGDQQSLQSLAYQRKLHIIQNSSNDGINNLQLPIQDDSTKIQKSRAKRLKQQISSTFCRAIKTFKSSDQGMKPLRIIFAFNFIYK